MVLLYWYRRKKRTPLHEFEMTIGIFIFYLILYNTCTGYVTLQIGCEHGIGINRF